MVTQEQLDIFGNWLIKARQEAKKTRQKGDFKRLTNKEIYSLADYDVRKKGDHYESFNKITGEGLMHAQTIEEAWQDLREEFGGI